MLTRLSVFTFALRYAGSARLPSVICNMAWEVCRKYTTIFIFMAIEFMLSSIYCTSVFVYMDVNVLRWLIVFNMKDVRIYNIISLSHLLSSYWTKFYEIRLGNSDKASDLHFASICIPASRKRYTFPPILIWVCKTTRPSIPCNPLNCG